MKREDLKESDILEQQSRNQFRILIIKNISEEYTELFRLVVINVQPPAVDIIKNYKVETDKFHNPDFGFTKYKTASSDILKKTIRSLFNIKDIDIEEEK